MLEFDPSKIHWTKEDKLIVKPDQVVPPLVHHREVTFEQAQSRLFNAIEHGAPEHEIDAIETWCQNLRWAGSHR